MLRRKLRLPKSSLPSSGGAERVRGGDRGGCSMARPDVGPVVRRGGTTTAVRDTRNATTAPGRASLHAYVVRRVPRIGGPKGGAVMSPLVNREAETQCRSPVRDPR